MSTLRAEYKVDSIKSIYADPPDADKVSRYTKGETTYRPIAFLGQIGIVALISRL